MKRRPPSSPLFPYPTLFRSNDPPHDVALALQALRVVRGPVTAELAAELREQADGAGTPEARYLLAALAYKALDHGTDRKSTRLNSSHAHISYAVFCLK